MKYLFGPVNSRRLGLSLGIDLLPYKICNFNCIYCEVGATSRMTCERAEYIPTEAILTEIDELLAQDTAAAAPDVFTITATGEPTLHTGIGRIIRRLKKRTTKPVAILTNGSLFHMREVRDDLQAADIVIPSLDAARPAGFRKINRPAACCSDPAGIIEGLRQFSSEFNGQFWLEVLLADGINDKPEDIAALQDAIEKIMPGRIQLNTVDRPPLEIFAEPLSLAKMKKIAAQLTDGLAVPVEIIATFSSKTKNADSGKPADSATEKDILRMLKRRPCTAADICEALHLDANPATVALEKLKIAGRLDSVTFNDKKYYQVKI